MGVRQADPRKHCNDLFSNIFYPRSYMEVLRESHSRNCSIQTCNCACLRVSRRKKQLPVLRSCKVTLYALISRLSPVRERAQVSPQAVPSLITRCWRWDIHGGISNIHEVGQRRYTIPRIIHLDSLEFGTDVKESNTTGFFLQRMLNKINTGRDVIDFRIVMYVPIYRYRTNR